MCVCVCVCVCMCTPERERERERERVVCVSVCVRGMDSSNSNLFLVYINCGSTLPCLITFQNREYHFIISYDILLSVGEGKLMKQGRVITLLCPDVDY